MEDTICVYDRMMAGFHEKIEKATQMYTEAGAEFDRIAQECIRNREKLEKAFAEFDLKWGQKKNA